MASVARPDTKTLFQIDPNWFAENGRDLREEVHALLCEECRVWYPVPADAPLVDHIHPETGEVTRVDALWESLAEHCGHLPGYIAPSTPLTTALFRALLANGNRPLTPEQLHKRVGKSNPSGILKVLMGAEIENGIVPVE